jgi:hypothetical protein
MAKVGRRAAGLHARPAKRLCPTTSGKVSRGVTKRWSGLYANSDCLAEGEAKVTRRKTVTALGGKSRLRHAVRLSAVTDA